MLVHVAPQSVVRNAYGRRSSMNLRSNVAYAVQAARRLASTWLTTASGPTPGTFRSTRFHVRPPSRVSCRLPSSVPTQITPACTGDSAML